MNYQETIAFLYDKLPAFQKLGAKAIRPKLFNIIRLCEHLGNPHLDFRSIHVAGTNGKGSTSHFLASVLQESGLKTGLYTSPHLKDYSERFRINGKQADQEYIIRFVEQNRDIIEEIRPSFFELSVALAFRYFADEKVDVAVIEVGLGGRFDSTNIITPVLSIITNIGYDHQDVLGDTLDKIASEKAGIIKQGVPVVVSEFHPETFPVFTAVAANMAAPLYPAWEYFDIQTTQNTLTNQLSVGIQDIRTQESRQLSSGLTGEYQQYNIKGVLTALEVLRNIGFSISRSAEEKGLENVIRNTGLKGRWQLLRHNPLVICDTGHNEHAFRITSRFFHEKNPAKCHLILGFVRDKDPEKLLTLFSREANYYLCTFNSFRALSPEELSDISIKKHLKAKIFTDVNQALEKALADADTDDIIFIGGSTYLVAEIQDL